MKQFLLKLALKWKLVILPAMLKLGFWGAAAAALLDSSSIPIPMDILIAGWVWNDKGHFWLYCLMGGVGSAIGGLVPYGIGRAGGELFLLKRVNRVRFDRLRDRFERQEFLAVMIPSMMPPPTPWKMFVFAAGVFEMRVLPFMLAVCCGTNRSLGGAFAAGAQAGARGSGIGAASRPDRAARGRRAGGDRLWLVVDPQAPKRRDAGLEQFRNTRRHFESIGRRRFLDENATLHCAFGLLQFRNCYSGRGRSSDFNRLR